MKSVGKVLIALLTLVFAWFSINTVLAAETYPPPPSDSFYAEDYTGTLSVETKKHINAIGYALDQKTHAQVVVVMVATVPDGDLESYANGLFRSRGLGDKEKNNGLLLLVSMKDRKARIEVGYGLEGAMNDAKAGRLLDTFLIPAFKEGDYSRGVQDTYDNMVQQVMKEYGLASLDGLSSPAVKEDSGFTMEDFLTPLVLLILLVIDWIFLGGRLTRLILFLLFAGRGGGRGGGGFGGSGRGGSSGGGGASRGW